MAKWAADARAWKRLYYIDFEVSYEYLKELSEKPYESFPLCEHIRHNYRNTIRASRVKFQVTHESLYHLWEHFHYDIRCDYLDNEDQFIRHIEDIACKQALGIYRPSRDKSFSITLSGLLIYYLQHYFIADLKHMQAQRSQELY